MTDRKQAIIVDLDGTAADTKHRLHLLPKKDGDSWDAFTEAHVNDTPVQCVLALVAGMHKMGVRVIFCTSRSAKYRSSTMSQLKRWGVLYTRLYMRNIGDKRPDADVKQDMLDMIREDCDVVFAVEDRPSVVKMWRDNGVPCFVVEQQDWVEQVWAAAIADAISCITDRLDLNGRDGDNALHAVEELRALKERGPQWKEAHA